MLPFYARAALPGPPRRQRLVFARALQQSMSCALGAVLLSLGAGVTTNRLYNRDRERPRGLSPPTPPGIRITYHGGSADSVKSSGVDTSEGLRVRRNSHREVQRRAQDFGSAAMVHALTCGCSRQGHD
jgi:hypothetical protein